MNSSPTSTSMRHYYYFFVGQQFSSFGSSLVSFAIIWYITITTESAWYLALASAASFGPMMVIQFVSGYITDSFDRKSILFVVDLLQAIATTVLMVVFILNIQSVWWIIGILLVRSLFDGLHRPAKGAILPSMVPKESLQKVNSLASTSHSIINLTSPVIGALLVVWVDHFWLILSIDVITFILAVIPLIFISIPDIRSNTSGESLTSKFFAGFSFLQNATGLFPLLFIFAMFNFFITPASMLLPLIILTPQGFASSEMIFAMVLIIFNLGFLIMSLFLTRVDLDISSPVGVVFGFTITIIGLSTITLGLYLKILLLFIIGELLIGLSFPIVNVFSSMIWQTQVPNQLQGRVISVRMIVTTFSLPVVMILAGIVAGSISFTLIFLASTVSFTLMIILIWLFTDFSLIETIEDDQMSDDDLTLQVRTISTETKTSVTSS